MGFLDFLFGKNKASAPAPTTQSAATPAQQKPVEDDSPTYLDPADVAAASAQQPEVDSKTLADLYAANVPDTAFLNLEYRFLTNSPAKAADLSKKLASLDYEVKNETEGALFVVTGLTCPIQVDAGTVGEWSAQMWQVSQEFDSRFDGWGADSDQ